ncbi:MAG: hypothetical protein ACJ8D5_09800 [Sphingomicrobium sp.]
MRKLLLLAGAAALIGAAPAVAKPGHGQGHGAHVANAKIMKTTRLDRNRNGIADADEALARKYGGALCPPGLWKKTPQCVPPGQAKRAFREGQRLSRNYRYYTPYGDIPLVLRNQYNLDPDYRYIYRDNVIYQVDPTTLLIRNIINAVL